MTHAAPRREDELLTLMERLQKLAFNQNPLRDSGVSMPQRTLLDWIVASPGCNVREVAEGLSLTAPTVSVGVRRLEDGGLVERRPDSQDGRAIQLFPTEQGQELSTIARRFRQEKMQRLLKGLTAEEGATLVTLLERAVGAAEEDAQSG